MIDIRIDNGILPTNIVFKTGNSEQFELWWSFVLYRCSWGISIENTYLHVDDEFGIYHGNS